MMQPGMQPGMMPPGGMPMQQGYQPTMGAMPAQAHAQANVTAKDENGNLEDIDNTKCHAMRGK